jgi:hypothetical protein
MLIVRYRNGVAVRLTDERWGHIARRHREMADQRDRVLETVADPDSFLEGDEGAILAARLYPQTPLTRKHLIVPYRELSPEDGFIVTAYFTNRPAAARRVIWTRFES